ncbi:DUF4124 domain-containing protein [Gilvimarinus sp. SDUM040013]|uniref:DUF4124 domain-containing protein n=1 Tax=Gilvimarinus gilvus TaxID=3058038 RepID=A0ABU4S261_9GAMM|nr:DUF4124 domain-containing protein [Gilvimarinus sp. SDUM040013]MDO3385478.1 DUF4124 domain-containing protein [Gilvimarinus sp. SDUM040013]MDX6851105.1 DUF4124 domain-containing protein [Gilvimarinus sp. SDUM040013]
MVRTVVATLIFCALSASAEVYKSVDKYGNVTFTDDPSSAQKRGEKTEKVNVPPTNIVPGGKAIEPMREEDDEPGEEHPDYQIKVISPTDQHTLTPGQRDLVIAVTTTAPLRHNAQFAYYMDGTLLGKTDLNNYSIREITRGEHNLHVEVIDRNDRVLSSSTPVTVYVHRPSLN